MHSMERCVGLETQLRSSAHTGKSFVNKWVANLILINGFIYSFNLPNNSLNPINDFFHVSLPYSIFQPIIDIGLHNRYALPIENIRRHREIFSKSY